MENIYLRESPSKIYIEVTTRCNLNCSMCVKQAEGCGIRDGDFDLNLSRSILSVLPDVNTVILSGIGEPLLYNSLSPLIEICKNNMQVGSRIGFQSNGMLIEKSRVRELLNSGLNLVCISVDAVSEDIFQQMRRGGNVAGAENAISIFREEALALQKELSLGVEFVITQKNYRELIYVLKDAISRGIDFAIISHLIPYDISLTTLSLYGKDTDRAIDLYERTRESYLKKGIDISRYFNIRWKLYHSEEEDKIRKAVEDMLLQAKEEKIFLNLQSILNRNEKQAEELKAIFSQAEALCKSSGVELILPGVYPRGDKRCEFIESGSVFISWYGDVHPCHFLWHKFVSYISGWKKYVNPISFGNLKENSLKEIWNKPEYINFRKDVASYEYPVCSNCSLAPCDYIYSEIFEQDCYTNTIPCCDCQWCLGLFNCLR